MQLFSSLKIATSITIAAIALSGCKKGSESISLSSDSSPEEMQSQSIKIAEAMEAGTPLACTMTTTDADTEVTQDMTYIVQGKKFKMDATQPAQGEEAEVKTHVISDGEFAYTWTDAENQGMKFKLPTESELQDSLDKAEQNNEAMKDLPDFSSEEKIKEYEDQGYTINCEETSVDANTFVPPTNVTFQDLSTMMNDVMDNATQGMSEEQRKQIEEAMKQYGN